jgi:hypothetical protein
LSYLTGFEWLGTAWLEAIQSQSNNSRMADRIA